jgi:hypothetical protein
MNETKPAFVYFEPLQFMVQYKDPYGALHNELLKAQNIDKAWTLAEHMVGQENRIQQIWQVKEVK